MRTFVSANCAICTWTCIILYQAVADCPRSEFTTEWWTWLCLTGAFLACSLGCKMVGLFTFFTIGTAVLVDLWDILDVKKGHTMVCACIGVVSVGMALTFPTGTLHASFCSSRNWFDRCPCYHVFVVLLHPLLGATQIRLWRRVHEPSIPRDFERKRDAVEQPRYSLIILGR